MDFGLDLGEMPLEVRVNGRGVWQHFGDARAVETGMRAGQKGKDETTRRAHGKRPPVESER